MGTGHRAVLLRFDQLCDLHPGAVAGRRSVGVRSSVFHYFECRGRRELAWQSGRDNGFSPGDAGGLRAGVFEEMTPAAGRAGDQVALNLSNEPDRMLLRHALATVAYRAGKALRGAPESFANFKIGETSRTPAQILAHLGDLYVWALA